MSIALGVVTALLITALVLAVLLTWLLWED